MKLLLGPILYAKTKPEPDEALHDTWSFFVNVFLDSASATTPPGLKLCFQDRDGKVVFASEEARPVADFTWLPEDTAGVVWRWEVHLPRGDEAQRLSYHFESPANPGTPCSFEEPPPSPGKLPYPFPKQPLRVANVVVPQRGGVPNIAFFSCNGTSQGNWGNIDDPLALWSKMLRQHESDPTDPAKTPGFQLLLGGGDQLYADSLCHTVEPLKKFMRLPRSARREAPLPDGVRDVLVAAYVRLYRERWGGEQGIGAMLRCVPGLFMWDDHDIIDGWGSLEKLQWAPWYRALYDAAARTFEAFQRGVLDQPRSVREPDDQESFSLPPGAPERDARATRHYFQAACFSTPECDLDLVLLDLRSGRTLRVTDPEASPPEVEYPVMSRPQWAAFDAWREQYRGRAENGKKTRHVLVVCSVPLVHLRFGAAVENGSRITALRDDMLDQWESGVHSGERERVIMNLFSLAKQAYCAVTVLSGDVHVGAHATLRSHNPDHLIPALQSAGQVCIEQATSSPIVHPPPSPMEFAGMLWMSQDSREYLSKGLETELGLLGETRYLRDRNWLSIRVDRPRKKEDVNPDVKARPRLWARWVTEQSKLSTELVVYPPPFLKEG
ncbi:hypothetical protein D7V97_31895 [Corallococcus sp. CA053C]|uniref:hypothetical protein n=1 Tax=Corallococcus sp. CA053C TaxID=2316732 RepID=UPI000EA3A746|nr:hypothetical protein [Corallococcus sp. CA053C]RKG99284.1 hypothetical protein D7V97_31895 [Corallococcus sp. CA053C]